MDVTVILCTYNRCACLANALDSVSASIMPEGATWEILVVDNNSSDNTHAVVLGYISRAPSRFRYLFEPKPGKSNALNSGLQNAQGRVVAFVDDDVTVDSKWLQLLTEPLLNKHWAGSGGRVLPLWANSPPKWLPCESPYARGPLVSFDQGQEAGPLNEPPFGTNMAFIKQVFEQHGGFRTDLGPIPGSEIRGEDSELGARLLAAGERLYYQPSAIVYHPVGPERQTPQYFLTWWFDKGRSEARIEGASSEGKIYLRGIPLFLVRRIILWTFRWLLCFRQPTRFENKINVWLLAGKIVEYSQRHCPTQIKQIQLS